jgi:hypothetical protein
MRLTATTRVDRDPGKGREAFRFHVRGETETFTLCANSKEDMDAWITCISANCAAGEPARNAHIARVASTWGERD